jgi:hypothetical protein
VNQQATGLFKPNQMHDCLVLLSGLILALKLKMAFKCLNLAHFCESQTFAITEALIFKSFFTFFLAKYILKHTLNAFSFKLLPILASI